MVANYVLIRETTLNASAASVTLSSIPQTGYTDLKLVASARSSAGSMTFGDVSFNGSTANFTGRYIEGDGASAGSNTDQPRLVASAPGSSTTTNTFGNSEVYIPNYTSSNYKSFSVDTTGENNATTSYMNLAAGLWSNTAAINQITITAQSSRTFVANSTFSLYGIAAVGATPTVVPKASGGDVVTNDGTYWIHQFYSSGTFIPNTNLSCDVLVVAGGGGAGSGAGGGGGAGGFIASTGNALTATAYAVTVGAGGTGGATGASNSGVSGSNSVFNSTTAIGGGFGGRHAQSIAAGNGGSGGGAGGGGNSNNTAATGTSGQGNNGGTAFNASGAYGGGGGGGASAVGSNGSSTNGGNGGNGTANSYSGSSVTYAGGGGAGTYSGGGGTFNGGTGGTGGGGNAATTTNGSGSNATANTGGGGGGGTYTSAYGAGGNGGSGIVVVRYLMA